MLGKLRIFSTFLVLTVPCCGVFNRVCNKCNQLVFDGQHGMQDRILEDGRKLKTKSVRSESECFVECLINCRCLSFSVCGNVCHLNAGNRHLVRNSLQVQHGCRYYDFPAYENNCDSVPSPTGTCCLPSSLLCINGGTCTVNVTDTTRRFECQCPNGYYGNRCQSQNPQTCMDYWTDETKPLSGEYEIVDSVGKSYRVFCDFDSEEDMGWTLFESFAVAHDAKLIKKPFTVDFPLNVSNLKWELFRLPKSVMSDVSSRSTYWRATCSYSAYGVDFRDYIRVRLAVLNPLNFAGYVTGESNQCLPVDYMNIRGKNCKNCTLAFFQDPTGDRFRLKPRYSRTRNKCTFDSSGVEYKCSNLNGRYAPLLGLYSVTCADPHFRCSANSNSTTEFWFGSEKT